jgi:hypothetical protein
MENRILSTFVVRIRGNGQAYQVLELAAPSGARLAIPRPDMDERLAPNTVGNYQRRLGIKTSFHAMPLDPPTSDPSGSI